MPQTPFLRVAGLHTFANPLSGVPDGSLFTADNIVIDKDGLIEPRRGLVLYGTAMVGASSRAKQLLAYKSRILRHYATTLEYDSDGAGTFVAFQDGNGANLSFTEPEAGIRIKSVEQNGNLFFTTSMGIKKISALTAADFSSNPVTSAGGIKALDLQTSLNSQVGFFNQESVVGYRVVWGIKDNNSNLILGAPSNRAVIYNPLLPLLINDLNNLLVNLDKYVLPGNNGYVSNYKTSPNDTYNTVRLNLYNAASKLDTDLATGNKYKGLVTQNAITGTPTTSQLTSLQSNFDGIIGDLQGETAPNWSPAGRTAVTVSTKSQTVNLSFLIPQGITVNHFYQIYRTAQTASSGSGILSTFDPGDEMGVVYEDNPTAAQISAGTITVQDITPDAFRGANLYTNPNSGEGITQANEVPPLARDITYFKGSTLYANTTTKHRLKLNLLGVSKLSPLLSSSATQYVTSVAVSANVCTMTFSAGLSASSNFAINNRIYLTGFTGASSVVNGERILSAVTSTTISFPLTTGNFTDNTAADFGSTYRISTLTVSNGPTTNTYTFYNPLQEVFTVTTTAGAAGLASKYFTFSSGKKTTLYYAWYKVDGVGTDPALAGTKGILVSIASTDTSTQVATKTAAAIQAFTDFTASSVNNVVSVTVNQAGIANGPVDFGTGFTFAVTTTGTGEDATNLRVLVSSLSTPSQQVDETSRSLVKVINANSLEQIYGFYLSGVSDVPGIMNFEARALGQTAFFALADRSETGSMFFSDLSPLAVTNISTSVGGISTITAASHGLMNGALVYLRLTNSTPSIDGVYTVQSVTTNTFGVQATVSVSGSSGALGKVKSDNEVCPNRIYFSKSSQPEAVPIVNYLDVGPKDEPIKRIIALRDSVFVLKSKSIYRFTGENSNNFFVTLFDSSAQILAPDSAAVLNNQIYMLSTQGVTTITDTGVQVVSRPIENLLTPLSTYTNFYTSTFGVGYEKDRAYLLFTVSVAGDTVATQCFRYNNFTQTWTRWPISKTAAVVNVDADRLFTAPADTNSIEIERKNFTRTDFADRQVSVTIPNGSVNGSSVYLSSLTNVNVGDLLSQTQNLTIGQFNQLLTHLDNDLGLQNKNYSSTLKAVAGDDLRAKLTSLATKLDADPRTFNQGSALHDYSALIAGYLGDFVSEQNAFNAIVGHLNIDPSLSDENYATSTGTATFEMKIDAINIALNQVTIDNPMPFIVGPATVYNAIQSTVTWTPHFFQDPSLLKHVSEATMMFQNNNFSTATVAFASDLMPSFFKIPFAGTGVGPWGEFVWGQGIWGGNGSSAPLRTYIPTEKQRCRYIVAQFVFGNAFEGFAIEGLSYSWAPTSSRGYR